MAIQSINPTNGQVIKEYQELTLNEIDQKLDRSYSSFLDWRETGFDHRASLMLKVAQLLKNDARQYGQIITYEMGKPITQSVAEIEKCAAACEFYAEHAEEFLANRPVATDAQTSYVRYDPIGPVLAVMPWNFPFWQVMRFVIPTLMAGNVGVLKHASNVPECALEIEKVFLEAGFPEGAFTTLLISSGPVAQVIKDERIRAVTLTGSEPAGKKVASCAGESLKKSVLELGGSDPFIVLADADLDIAAEAAARSRLINCGQTCISAKRFIVHQSVADDFVEKFQASLSSVKVGDPMKEDTEVGPMARTDLRQQIHKQVLRAVEEGSTLVMGGTIPRGRGFYYPVTLLTGVEAGMAIAEEETFGPVASVTVVENDDEAIEFANDTDFGLGASIWTADLERAHDMVRRVEAGAVFVNGLVKSDPRLPFGGVKSSGYGRELSEEGIREFVNIKTVWMAK